MFAHILSSAWIIALFILYYFSDSPSRDVLLVAAVVVAISDAANRISGDPR